MSYPPQYLSGGATRQNQQKANHFSGNSIQLKSKQQIPTSQTQISISNTHRSSTRILQKMIDTDDKEICSTKNDRGFRHQKISDISSQCGHEQSGQDLYQQQQHNFQEQENGQEEEYIQMVVELDSENSLSLKVHPHDNPLILAQQFCYSQNIDPKIITPFAKQIRQMQANNWPTLNPVSFSTSISDPRNYWGHSKASQISTKTENYLNSSITQPNCEKQNDKIFCNQTNSSIYTNTKSNSNSRVNYNAPKVYHSDKTVPFIAQNQSRVPQNSVFDRLYKDSEMKNKKQQEERVKEKALQSRQRFRNYPNDSKQNLSQSTTIFQNLSSENQNSIHNSNSIIQLKIYDKNTKLQQESRLRNSYLKEQYENMKQEECTNQPQINPLSRLIVQKLRQDQSYFEDANHDQEEDQSFHGAEGNKMRKNNFVRLYQQKEKSKQKNISRIIEYTKEKQEKEMRECTFHPKILKKSQCQVLNTQRHLLLYEDFYIRQNKSKTTKASQTKKKIERYYPEINQVSKTLTKGRTFNERMVEYKQNADRNKERLERQIFSLQKHRPQINRNSKNNKKRNMSIGEHLYSKSLQKKQVKQQKTKVMVDKKSDFMYEKMKLDAFRHLFMQLDSDQDGFISPLRININLNPEILQLLAPLLSQMEQVQIQLDEEEFVNSLIRLFNTMNIQQRNTIVNVTKNPRRKWQSKQQPSFHPCLDQKSIEIARDTRQPGISLYELGVEKQMQKQYKLNQLRALKAMIEFEQCTFHPNLFAHH